MSFTKRDYEAIARIIADTRSRYFATHGATAARDIADNLGAYFATCNERFDQPRFLKACEPGGGK